MILSTTVSVLLPPYGHLVHAIRDALSKICATLLASTKDTLLNKEEEKYLEHKHKQKQEGLFKININDLLKNHSNRYRSIPIH